MTSGATPANPCEDSTHAAQADLRERSRRLDELAAELDFFSRSVTHDLRAPLRTIGGFSRLLQQEYSQQLPEVAQTYLSHIIGSVERMDRLITSMFALSQTSHKAVERQTVNLSQIAGDVLARHQAVEPARRVAWCIAPDLLVHADPALLWILLDNLIGNAWKFTGTRPLASIEIGCRADDGDEIYFIRDNGAGFDMTHVGNLFQPFQRLHHQSDFPGSGIGLTIVRRIVCFHGGRIWAESGGGMGATFHFSLMPPVAKPVPSTQAKTARTGRMPALLQANGGQG